MHPKEFVRMSVTVYVPAALYVCEGLCAVEKFPSPKFQFQFIIFPVAVVERSVNTVGLLKQTEGAVNAGTGSGFTITN